MKNFHIAGKIPPDHYIALQEIQNATGQTQSRLLREAIALYLKKSKAVMVGSRLDALEEKVSKRGSASSCFRSHQYSAVLRT